MNIEMLRESGIYYFIVFQKARVKRLVSYYSKHPEEIDDEIRDSLTEDVAALLEEKCLLSIDTLKLFVDTFFSDGGFLKVNPDSFVYFMSSIDTVYALDNWTEFDNFFIDFRHRELSKIKDDYDNGFEKENTKGELEKLVLILEQSSISFKDYDTTELIDYLLKNKYKIDLQKGIGLSEVSDELFEIAVDYIAAFLTLNYEKDADRRQYDFWLNAYRNHLIKRIDECKENPETILLNERLILELYNLTTCEYNLHGVTLPTQDGRNEILELLSLLPKQKELEKEEQEYLDETCLKYQDKLMPEEEWKRFSSLYLKKLYNLITTNTYGQNNVYKYSDVIMAQYAKENPAIGEEGYRFLDCEYKNLDLIALWDTINMLNHKQMPDTELRIDMMYDSVNPLLDGVFFTENRITINPSIVDTDTFVETMDTIYHELDHAQLNYELIKAIYSTPFKYLGCKLLVLQNDLSCIVDELEGKFNYHYSPIELSAGLAGSHGVIDFLKRHKIEDRWGFTESSQLLESKVDKSNIMKNPAFYMQTTGIRRLLEPKVFDILKLYHEKNKGRPFDPNLLKECKKEYEDSHKEISDYEDEMMDNEKKILSFFDGPNVDLNKLFDRFIELHPEFCAEGHYFAIEYTPEGKRKSLRQILSDLNELGTGEDSQGKRDVYRYIIKDRILQDGNPAKNLKALMKYKPTNEDNATLIEEIVEDNIDTILSRLRVHFSREGDVSGKMNKALQYIMKLCELPDSAQTPFVKGVVASGVLESKKNFDSILFSTSDIGRKCFGKIFDKKKKSAEEKTHIE